MRSLSFTLISVILFLLTACGAGNLPCRGVTSPLPTEDCEKYEDTEDQVQCYNRALDRQQCFFSGFRQKKLKHYGELPKAKAKPPLPQPQKKVEVEVIDYLKVGKDASLEGCLAALKLQEAVTLKNPNKMHIEGARYTALLAVCINKM